LRDVDEDARAIARVLVDIGAFEAIAP